MEAFSQMVDTFLENDFNYFDTAHGYLGGKSETALRECLTSRYPRSRYILTDKLTNSFFKEQKDIRPFFESQLRACGVEYFDIYLMHAQGADSFAYFKKHHAYETALELMPEYESCHGFLNMLDASKGLAPGDPVRMAERIIESADKEPAPLRMVLGSQALSATLARLKERVADYETQTELAASTDFPVGE